jgi:RNA polymerase sigma-70 factor (ECF subfamily)
MMKLTDVDKILAIKKKNEFLVGKIYALYRNEFLFFLQSRFSINPDDILEIYQDAFLVLCNKIYENKLNADNLKSSLKTYLFGVGLRIAFNVSRRNGKMHEQEFNETFDIPEDESVLGEENEKIIQKAVNEMGEPCHTILVKQYWEGKSGDEIAVEMNYKNPDTAKTQKYKCIQKLKSELKGKMVYHS